MVSSNKKRKTKEPSTENLKNIIHIKIKTHIIIIIKESTAFLR